MKIIFVCKYNRFRSKIAEAYFKKINKNKNIHAISGGVFKGEPVADSVVNFGKKVGLKISRNTNCLKEKDLVKADLIVIVADNVPSKLFKRFKNIRVWKIPDTSQSNNQAIEKIGKNIMSKILELTKELRDKK